ncbi:hypothetical protein EB796_017445 [Bugula neritina]|uniref:Uncharacterized protein n=1 Tax=Bugula neritina TaxID=10212 RepID=A0A7J7JFW4_BUGNE|nr:hypothetical protein EB796_017445 [Bugula neritina]
MSGDFGPGSEPSTSQDAYSSIEAGKPVSWRNDESKRKKVSRKKPETAKRPRLLSEVKHILPKLKTNHSTSESQKYTDNDATPTTKVFSDSKISQSLTSDQFVTQTAKSSMIALQRSKKRKSIDGSISNINFSKVLAAKGRRMSEPFTAIKSGQSTLLHTPIQSQTSTLFKQSSSNRIKVSVKGKLKQPKAEEKGFSALQHQTAGKAHRVSINLDTDALIKENPRKSISEKPQKSQSEKLAAAGTTDKGKFIQKVKEMISDKAETASAQELRLKSTDPKELPGSEAMSRRTSISGQTKTKVRRKSKVLENI